MMYVYIHEIWIGEAGIGKKKDMTNRADLQQQALEPLQESVGFVAEWRACPTRSDTQQQAQLRTYRRRCR